MSAATISREGRRRRTSGRGLVLVRGLVVLALAVDAVVHARLAGGYQSASPGGMGTGTLFWLEAIAATLAGLWVLWRGSRAAYAAAATVALSAGAAVVLYRYVDVPAFGPLPAMYEPVWYFRKALSAVAEAVGGIAAAGASLRLSGAVGTSRQS